LKLEELINEFIHIKNLPDIDITDLNLDSRKVKGGCLFFAYPGTQVDGRDYIKEAVDCGAVAVLYEPEDEDRKIKWISEVPIIPVRNLAQKTGYIAAKFYHNPSHDMLVIGITGTNGKTSGSYLLANALQLLGKKTAIIGTMGSGLPGDLCQVEHITTPDPITLQAAIKRFYVQGVECVVIEASSHALDQGRVAGVEFDMGIFTNLTRDHLEYHGSIANYTKAKRKLFALPALKYAVLNIADPVGLGWFNELKQKDDLKIMVFSQKEIKKEIKNLIYINNVGLHANGFDCNVFTPYGQGQLKSSLLGRFNIDNLLVVLSSLLLLGYPLDKVLKVIAQLQTVPGRMATYGGKCKPLVVVDYAHTADALFKALSSLKEHCQGKLFCIFGCGGSRDRAKRTGMAQVAEKLADHVIITDDNPRLEDPDAIIKDILTGFDKPELVQVERNRELAIRKTIQSANKGDIILLAGKGHENYQIVGDKYLPFSEAEIVKQTLKSSL
jgi:UDP-N-acetylmuramoyl-L-alanyl-D-glutamate--2,6-diaminopimelate ligase